MTQHHISDRTTTRWRPAAVTRWGLAMIMSLFLSWTVLAAPGQAAPIQTDAARGGPAHAGAAAGGAGGKGGFARGLPTQAAPSSNASAALDQQVQDAGEFMRHSQSGSVYFDVHAAVAAGASPETLEIGAVVNQMTFAQATSPTTGPGSLTSAVDPASSGPMATAQFSLPVWGNWCGPGHGGGEPVDVLDSLCRTHDECYGTRGYFACSCDQALINDIRANAYRMGFRERIVAAAVSTYFTYTYCVSTR